MSLTRVHLLALVIFLFCGCATLTKVTKSGPVPSTQFKNTMVPGSKSYAPLPGSPAADMVNQAVREFKKNNFELAEWNLEQAVTVDSNYGPAYYWLARVKFRQGDLLRSLELLHRAEELLAAHQAWLDRVQDFKLHVRTMRAVEKLN